MFATVEPLLVHFATSALVIALVTIVADLWGLEWLLVLISVSAAKRLTRFADSFFDRIEVIGSRLARNSGLSILALSALGLVLRLCMLPIRPIPHPVIADEFSQLLLAGTLASGRLSNPPHPLWHSFETLHVIPLPTYNSMYLPGPALLLALGKALTGTAWFGVLLGTSFLPGLIYWALRGWMPARWAFLAGLIAVLKISLISYWVDSYWGGTFAALGGALILGALPRLQKKPGIALSVALAVGIGMLANSRPYEGAAFCIPPAASMIRWLLKRSSVPAGLKVLRCAVPIACCLAVIAVAMGIYFRAVTGNATTLPYQVNQQRYGWPMTLPWTRINYVKHSRKEFAQYFKYELRERKTFWSLPRFLGGVARRAQQDWRFYVGPALSIPLFFLPYVWRKPRLRLLFLSGAATIVAAYLEPHFPHYMAPATVAIIATIVEGYRHLRLYRRYGIDFGRRLSRAIPLILLIVVGIRLGSAPLHVTMWGGYTSWCCSNGGSVNQEKIIQRLPAKGKHLILVRYHSQHQWVEEWVFNEPRIDQARVVWARELGGKADQDLLNYFKDRQVWIFEPDFDPPRLTRLRPPISQTGN